MNLRSTTIACLVTALLLVAPAASALMLAPAWRDPPAVYVAAGNLHGASGAQSFQCRTALAPTTATLVERPGNAWTLAFVASSACGPLVDEGPGTRDADGVIRGTGVAGATWEVRELLFRAADVEGHEAGLAAFHLAVRTSTDVGPRVAFAASGWLSGVGADAGEP